MTDKKQTRTRALLETFTLGGQGVPEHLKDGIERYVEKGIPNGSGLSAVFAGNIYSAFARLDDESRLGLPAIIGFIACHLPTACYGDSGNVADWNSSGGIQGQGGWSEFGH